jgi:hypothetical protein
VRRRLQHAAAADAVGHRPGRASARRTASTPAIDLPGVGANLQDRYEVALAPDARWRILDGAKLRQRRCALGRWNASRAGMYSVERRGARADRPLRADEPEPDLFCMALLARFEAIDRISRS